MENGRKWFELACAACLMLFVLGCDRTDAPPTSVVSTPKVRTPEELDAPHGKTGPSVESTIRFTEMPADRTGVAFRHVSGNSPERPFPAANGSGIAMLDFDRDGWLDLYFLTGTQFPIDLTRAEPRNRLYRNLGEWRFDDVTDPNGLGHNGYSAGVAVGDIDNDGFPDVYVTCYGADRLYRNAGDGTFHDVSEVAGIADSQWGTSVAFLDADGDGLLDVYVCNYAEWSPENNPFCGDRQRNIRLFCSPTAVPPAPDVFYRNNGDGTFRDDTTAVGLDARAARSQGVVTADVNGDGWVDIYVGNDLNPNSLFLNDGQGRFQDVAEFSGVAYDAKGRSQAGMGVDAADVNRDGLIDLFVTNFEHDHNTLYTNSPGFIFQDESFERGVGAESVPWVGWGTRLVDLDSDGWRDLLVANGHTDDNFLELGRDAPYQQPPLVWRNLGQSFAFVGTSAGEYFARRHPGRGLATGDLDNDGDPDVVIQHQDRKPALLRNDSSPIAASGWKTQLQVIGTQSNRDASGVTVEWERSADDRQVEVIAGGGSYLSASATWPLTLLRSSVAENAGIRLRWPGGRETEVTAKHVGAELILIEDRHR